MASKPIYLGVIGVGGVGTAFLQQLSKLPNAPSLVLLARSSKTLLAPTPSYSPAIPAADWATASSAPSITTSGTLTPSEVVSYLSSAPGRSVLVDNTSDPNLASAYPEFLKAGISIVTPNKKGFSSDLSLWKDIFASAATGKALVYHESTVGAGLPVISTLRDLVATGDEVTRIEGVFSGTLSFLFNTFAPVSSPAGTSSANWSDVVSQAKELGYTEPDPRDDLNGMDVARKLTILARIAGLEVQSPDSFPIESLIPAELASLPATSEGVAEFMKRLPEFDGQMAALKEQAEKAGKVVRYVGSVDVGKKEVKVGLQQFAKDSAIAGLKGSDNIISFYTKRYGSNPLIIQGAGAGGDVTAMGVTADLIKVLERL
ncbi:homoserine dehydrogenase [Talaromyces stipitatus ATCC 10500]|uniref:Homoserine dehydrogenase n=1 Tax=Talaromyces stipitatus (strain ATCC 10500 / CBS 375.48 / QM 6759 / NRRL 1006) TaxID=441959 RepID=B8M599_TALSN|nr:homoserine dehydrogenase [Talaromyces stipitatus ATCC 10500]XP_002480140.1 homoserine dehydrogenase [Talaromyces stipitatus ATCC 10500]EED19705.1 homoserine dehydrogenase [Talaromyces stipitatus ATCC 10500]EED19706.1 homoserine dehydrogenase [Talaromyces stipitatus ATCC 10500]